MDLNKRTLARLVKNPFLLSVTTLASGTLLAQIINLLFIPLITRLYGPEAYGGLGYYTSLIAFLTPLSALCYPLAIVLPRLEKEALYIARLSQKIALLLTAIIGASVYTLTYTGLYKLPIDTAYFYLAIGMLISFYIVLYTQFCIRHGKYRQLSASLVIVALSSGIMKLGIGYFAPTTNSLILITLLNLLIHAFLLSRTSLFDATFSKLLKAGGQREAFVIKKYWRFPTFRLPHALNAVASQVAPVFLLTTFFDVTAAGFFILTRTALATPVTLVGKSVYDVAYPKIARQINQGTNFNFIVKSTAALFALGLIPLIIIILFGEELFGFVFGGQWVTAGTYASVMAIWFLFNFANKSCAAAISAYKLDGFLFRNGLLNLFLSTLGFFVGYLMFDSDIAAVALFSAFSVVCQILLIGKTLHHVNKTDFKVISKPS
jgi:O-antigen/teichoic acid export membrane protein